MGSLGDEFKILWLIGRLCEPMQSGGLGVWNLMLFDKVLFGKWLWRDVTKKQSFWRTVVHTKHGTDWGNWVSYTIKESYGVSQWRHIHKGHQ